MLIGPMADVVAGSHYPGSWMGRTWSYFREEVLIVLCDYQRRYFIFYSLSVCS